MKPRESTCKRKRRINASATVVTISPYGETGPQANDPASDLTLFFASGISRRAREIVAQELIALSVFFGIRSSDLRVRISISVLVHARSRYTASHGTTDDAPHLRSSVQM